MTDDRAGCLVWLLFLPVGVVVIVALTRAGVSESIAGMVATLAAMVGVPLLFILRDEWNPRRWRERRRQREEAHRRVAAAEAARAARRRRPCAIMNRAMLIEHVTEFAPFHPGCNIMAGMHTAALRELCETIRERREWSGLLPGETRDGWSVYRIQFEDGAAYVGMTGGAVIARMGRHLHGDGAAGIGPRCRAGVAYRLDVLASGLTERAARRVELVEIGKLRQPLNMTGSRAPAPPLPPTSSNSLTDFLDAAARLGYLDKDHRPRWRAPDDQDS